MCPNFKADPCSKVYLRQDSIHFSNRILYRHLSMITRCHWDICRNKPCIQVYILIRPSYAQRRSLKQGGNLIHNTTLLRVFSHQNAFLPSIGVILALWLMIPQPWIKAGLNFYRWEIIERRPNLSEEMAVEGRVLSKSSSTKFLKVGRINLTKITITMLITSLTLLS